jgi:hypothetical protein
VRKLSFLTIPATLCLFVTMATPQTKLHFPTPPEPMDQQGPKQASASPTRHIDMAQAQRCADDLARTAQTIPTDIASVRQGMLPKDVIEKLKQIEKLSKHLRTELNP